MIKKLLLVISFGIVFAVYGGNIGTFDPNRDTWLVDTGKIKCEFLEGCMYPSAFQKEGYYYPDFSLLDELQTPAGKYYLKDERWADIKIIENTPDVFKVECRGKFGLNAPPRYRICKNSDAVYCYTFYRNSGRVEMKAKVSVNDNSTVKYTLLHAGWLYHGFSDLILNGKIFKTARGKKIDIPSEGAILKNSFAAVAVPGNAVLNMNYKRYDKNSNLFQHLKVLHNCGELQKNGTVNADLILEFR